MHCVFPTCEYDTGRNLTQEITLYRFPAEASLRTAWLEALGKAGWDLEEDSAVCSKHFLTEDFLVTRSGRKLRSEAVPVANVQVCRICFAKDCKLYRMRDDMQLDLSRPSYALAYETLTGLTVEEDRLPQYLCIQCANRLITCVRFRANCLRAHSILLEIVNDYGYITLDSILSFSRIQNPLRSNVTHDQSNIEHAGIDNTYTNEQDLKQEDVTIDAFEPENDEVFDQKILITDIRSTNDRERSLYLQDDVIVSIVKTENYKIMNRDIPNNEVVTTDDTMCSPTLTEDTVDDHASATNNDANDQFNYSKESDNDFRAVSIGGDWPVNGSLSPEKTRRKDKISPTKVKNVARLTKVLNKTKVNINWKREPNGGLLLSYKLLSCDMCNYQTVSKVQLLHHINAHTTNIVYNCNKCYFLTNSKKRLQLHIQIHSAEKHLCDICNKTFTYKSDLRTHMRIHSGDKPYSCDICSKRFTQHNQLTVHLRIHSDEKPYSCNICNKAFRQKGQLKIHLRIHSGEKPYSCDVCNKAFIQKGQLQNHFQIHSNEKRSLCDICGKVFNMKGGLQSHLRIHMDKIP